MVAIPPAVTSVTGCTVSRLIFDDAIHLILRSRTHEATIRLDAEAHFDWDGTVYVIDHDRKPTSSAPLLALLDRRLSSVELAEDGELVLRFAEASLRALPHDHNVSWSVSDSAGQTATCIAEGMVVWQS